MVVLNEGMEALRIGECQWKVAHKQAKHDVLSRAAINAACRRCARLILAYIGWILPRGSAAPGEREGGSQERLPVLHPGSCVLEHRPVRRCGAVGPIDAEHRWHLAGMNVVVFLCRMTKRR